MIRQVGWLHQSPAHVFCPPSSPSSALPWVNKFLWIPNLMYGKYWTFENRLISRQWQKKWHQIKRRCMQPNCSAKRCPLNISQNVLLIIFEAAGVTGRIVTTAGLCGLVLPSYIHTLSVSVYGMYVRADSYIVHSTSLCQTYPSQSSCQFGHLVNFLLPCFSGSQKSMVAVQWWCDCNGLLVSSCGKSCLTCYHISSCWITMIFCSGRRVCVCVWIS